MTGCDMLDYGTVARKNGKHLPCESLAAENAELREENERFIIKLNVEHIARQNVESENNKLRELVGDMWTYITEPVSKRNELKERLARLDDIGDRMRELGVEVDG